MESSGNSTLFGVIYSDFLMLTIAIRKAVTKEASLAVFGVTCR